MGKNHNSQPTANRSLIGTGAGKCARPRFNFQMSSSSNSIITDVLDVKEAARFLRLHPVTLREKAAAGEIPGKKIGRVWRFRLSVLERWMSDGVEFQTALRSHGGQ